MNRIDRLEFLEKLEERVLNETLIPYKYFEYVNGKKCFCVLGHAYNIIGRDILMDRMNSEEISKVYSALDSDLLINESCGLSIREFSDLQNINDNCGGDKYRLLEYIKELKEQK